MKYLTKKNWSIFSLSLACFLTSTGAANEDSAQSQQEKSNPKNFDPESNILKEIPGNDPLQPYDNQNNHSTENNTPSSHSAEGNESSTPPPSRRVHQQSN